MSDWYPKASKPRQVEGGLKARSKRGAIAQTWWSVRFIEVLESIVVGGRMQRGRAYARKGQVIDLIVTAGSVTASVQGSRARPYKVRIGLQPLDKSAWNGMAQALADNAWFAAKLLAGELPVDIDEVFQAQGLSLFPVAADDLSMDCSCPDWGVPCKHLAAAFYLLAERFDEDPFEILAWRGRERDDLLQAVSVLRSGGVPGDQDPTAGEAFVPLDQLLDTFYDMQGSLPKPPRPDAPVDAILDQLPQVDVTVRKVSIVDVLRSAYVRLPTISESNDRG